MFFSYPMINWQAELKGKSFLCRTAASFVSARIGIVAKAPILPKDLGNKIESTGGLIVVGSYVPKTTKQVDYLFRIPSWCWFFYVIHEWFFKHSTGWRTYITEWSFHKKCWGTQHEMSLFYSVLLLKEYRNNLSAIYIS